MNQNGNFKTMNESDYFRSISRLDIYSVLRELSRVNLDSFFCKKISILVGHLKERYKEINYALGVYDKENWCLETGKEIEYFLRMNKNIKTKLGEGSFSSAYLGYDGYVYKVNIKPKGYDSWLDYAYHAMNNDNEFFPKIYEIKTFKDTYCIKAERLQLIKYEDYDNKYSLLKDAFEKDDLGLIVKILSSSDNEVDKLNEWYSVTSKIKQETGAIWDIRFDNFLKRNEQLVINDPLAFGVSSNLNFK